MKSDRAAKRSAPAATNSGGNGSAAKLINDPALYNDVHALLGRVDSLVADVKKNPKRYINVKVF